MISGASEGIADPAQHVTQQLSEKKIGRNKKKMYKKYRNQKGKTIKTSKSNAVNKLILHVIVLVNRNNFIYV